MEEKTTRNTSMIDLNLGHIVFTFHSPDRVDIKYTNKALMWGDNEFNLIGRKDEYGSAIFNGLCAVQNRLAAISDYAVTMFLSGYLTQEGLDIANESRNEVDALTILSINHS